MLTEAQEREIAKVRQEIENEELRNIHERSKATQYNAPKQHRDYPLEFNFFNTKVLDYYRGLLVDESRSPKNQAKYILGVIEYTEGIKRTNHLTRELTEALNVLYDKELGTNYTSPKIKAKKAVTRYEPTPKNRTAILKLYGEAFAELYNLDPTNGNVINRYNAEIKKVIDADRADKEIRRIKSERIKAREFDDFSREINKLAVSEEQKTPMIHPREGERGVADLQTFAATQEEKGRPLHFGRGRTPIIDWPKFKAEQARIKEEVDRKSGRVKIAFD